jgi:hypothetical protein
MTEFDDRDCDNCPIASGCPQVHKPFNPKDAVSIVGQAIAKEQLSPEPNQVNLERLDLKRFYSLAIPTSFIYCRQDKALPPGNFHPRMSSRLGEFKLLEMDGSHEVMFTRTEELADKIIEASFD